MKLEIFLCKLERANRSSGRSESKIAVLEWSVGGPVAVLGPAGERRPVLLCLAMVNLRWSAEVMK